jgi:hypothetical protein
MGINDIKKYLPQLGFIIAIIVVLQFTGIFKITDLVNEVSGFSNLLDDSPVQASLPMGSNETNLSVGDLDLNRTPSTCYPQQALKPEDLLPSQESDAIKEFNLAQPIGEGILADVNLLDAGSHIGVNTVGQSLRNANRQLRSDPPNPQVNVSPWMNTTISPDLPRRPLEVGESCGV